MYYFPQAQGLPAVSPAWEGKESGAGGKEYYGAWRVPDEWEEMDGIVTAKYLSNICVSRHKRYVNQIFHWSGYNRDFIV